MAESRSILSNTKLIALCTLASRVTGLARDMLLAHVFGAAWIQDVFSYAFQIPNLFRRLLGEGALSAAFVPVFARSLEADGRERAWALLARTLALLTVALLAVVAIVEVAIGAFAWLRAADGLILALTAVTTPFMLTVCLVALFSSVLNCVGSFVPAALVSIVLNVVMIAAIVWAGPAIGGTDLRSQMHVVAWSVPLAGVLQILFLLPALRAKGVPLGWKIDLSDREVRSMLARLGPVALGQGAILVSTYLDTQTCIMLTGLKDRATSAHVFGFSFEYPLMEGALSCVTVAQRLYQFPMGVLVISMATAAFPVFSRLAAREEWQEWTKQLRDLLRMAAFEGVLVGAAMIVLAEPIVRLLFEYGRFDATATQRSAGVLACYGLGMWAFGAQAIIQRGFYSVGDVNTPLWISLVTTPLNLALSLVLVWQPAIREAAFALSSATTASGAFLVGAWLLSRRQHGAPLDAAGVSAFARMILAALIAGAVTSALYSRVHAELASMNWSAPYVRVVETFLSLGVLSALYLGLTYAMKLPESQRLVRRVLRRRAPKAASASS